MIEDSLWAVLNPHIKERKEVYENYLCGVEPPKIKTNQQSRGPGLDQFGFASNDLDFGDMGVFASNDLDFGDMGVFASGDIEKFDSFDDSPKKLEISDELDSSGDGAFQNQDDGTKSIQSNSSLAFGDDVFEGFEEPKNNGNKGAGNASKESTGDAKADLMKEFNF